MGLDSRDLAGGEVMSDKPRYYVIEAHDRDGWYIVDRKDGENYAWRAKEKDARELADKKNGKR